MPIRVGFIGAGGISGMHLSYLTKADEAEVVAVSDVVEERAKERAESCGANAYTRYDEMLDREDLDAVYVCLPPFAHGEPEFAAIERGLHLFVEKPIATDLDTAREILSGIEEKGLVSAVGYQWRYLETTEKARSILEDRTVGMVLGYWMGGLPGVPWWRVTEQSGGQMVEQTTHIVDLARYVAGDVRKVYAAYALQSMTDVPDLDVPDVGTVTLEFEDGAVGTISNTCMLSQGYRVGLHVVARDLVLELEGGTLRCRGTEGVEEFRAEGSAPDAENRAFIEAITSGDTSGIRSTYADAFETHRVTMAANESARTGKPVDLGSA